MLSLPSMIRTECSKWNPSTTRTRQSQQGWQVVMWSQDMQQIRVKKLMKLVNAEGGEDG